MPGIFHAYSDESGDEGKNSKRWFINTAVIVRDEDENEVKNYELELKQSIWENKGMTAPKIIHWNEITQHTVRKMISEHLGKKPFVSISICIDKRALPEINDRDIFFQFTCKLLIERVSWYVDDLGGRFTMTFCKRGGLTTAAIRASIAAALLERKNEIRPVFNIDDLQVQPMERYIMLRVADNNASALGNALNEDKYGCITSDYFDNLYNRVYRYKGWNRRWKYGIKIYPCEDSRKGFDNFIKEYPHTANWFK